MEISTGILYYNSFSSQAHIFDHGAIANFKFLVLLPIILGLVQLLFVRQLGHHVLSTVVSNHHLLGYCRHCFFIDWLALHLKFGSTYLLNNVTARRFIVLYGLIINCSTCVPVAKSNT